MTTTYRSEPATGDVLTDEEMKVHFPKITAKDALVVVGDRMWKHDTDGWVCLGDGSEHAS